MSQTDLITWADRAIKVGFYLLFILVPIILTPWNYELFEYNKMMVVYAMTVIITAAWLIKALVEGKLKIARTPLDLLLLIFLGSQLLATIFSLDPHVSWMGYYSRFNSGLWSIFAYLLLYYAFVSNFKGDLLRLLKVALATSVVVALYGVAEHFGIDRHLWVQDVQNRVFSTLGQPNWLAAYLVALLPLALAFALKNLKPLEERSGKFKFWDFWRNSNLDFWIWSVVSFLFFLVLLYTRSRSGLFGLVIADLLFWGLVIYKNRTNKSLLISAGLYHVVFFLILFINGTHVEAFDKYFSLEGWRARLTKAAGSLQAKAVPAPASTLLEVGGTESGAIRKYVWLGAINAWKSSTKTILIGTGTETFAFAFYQFRPQAHNLTSEWDFLYNKAHNEYLNYLATTGALGLGSYLLFIGAFIFWFGKVQSSIWKNSGQAKVQNDNFAFYTLQFALFAGWFSVLATNFFGFSVVMLQLFLFLFPAFILVSVQPDNNLTLREFSLGFISRYLKVSKLLVGLTGLFLLFTIAKFWYADTLFANGYRLDRAGQFAAAEPYLRRAVNLNTDEPLYHDEFSSDLAGLAAQLIEQKQATPAAELIRQSLSESDKALAISPKNVNFWKTRTKIYYSVSSYLPEMNQAAIGALNQALSLSPTDPKIYYNLAILYGRQNDNDRAIENLKKAIELKPNYRDAYYALYVFYGEVKKPDLAKQTLEDYLAKVDPNDKDFLQRLGR